eukprot:5860979-Pyramimonas_sp.AAC.1
MPSGAASSLHATHLLHATTWHGMSAVAGSRGSDFTATTREFTSPAREFTATTREFTAPTRDSTSHWRSHLQHSGAAAAASQAR